MDGIILKHSWVGERKNVSVVNAIGLSGSLVVVELKLVHGIVLYFRNRIGLA